MINKRSQKKTEMESKKKKKWLYQLLHLIAKVGEKIHLRCPVVFLK